MELDQDHYLLINVMPEEFKQLKEQESDLVSKVKDKYNGAHKSEVKDLDATIKYNPKINFVGIFIKRGENQHLVIEKKELSEAEDSFVFKLYECLESRLKRIRLPKEKWVDSV